MSKSPKHVTSMELAESRSATSAVPRLDAAVQSISEDDRYPGSFFRVPGVPAPGKTTWSLAK
jgi:hypothetical protein